MKRWILLLLALLPLLAHARENNHSQWNPEIAAFVAADQQHLPPPGSILFIGSSSIQHWKSLAADFPELSVINRGFGGSEINDSTFFANSIVAPYHARAIVMYAGDNDLQDGGSPEQVRDDFAAFVRKARAVNPDVPIAFIAIKPSVARAVLLPKIHQANALVRAYAATQHGVTYLDVFTPMLGKNGGPQPDLFGDDGLHMNRKGYLLWISVIKPWVDAVPR
ncbi:SGNH/GDSL hydrolase family protein [Rhodanobacter sp. MP7CTX1]|jgi:lysophospholipase L1-like esterase|uniref:SGNH/GDSL hydrolase family protein n=1 Tax=Rhodanobacter sp. MP7CTX1 TaxID=2723084 RepID=UPI001620B332|nr:SGNH/GDSL hydrolase family protein [Rhodanobacter sp. MP7CTX1]MBB6186021.1 lysophospholipase L1-like esterase [Rhodanobacter sp. MP7CTX1]